MRIQPSAAVRAVIASLAWASSLVLPGLPGGVSRADERLVFVVNKDNPVSSVSLEDIQGYFMKTKKFWPDGTSVRFIDWKDNTPARKAFLDEIMRKSSRDVELYWIGQKLYTGDSAPIQVPSEALVTRFVAKFRGAIGYLPASKAVSLPEVKTVPVTGGN